MTSSAPTDVALDSSPSSLAIVSRSRSAASQPAFFGPDGQRCDSACNLSTSSLCRLIVGAWSRLRAMLAARNCSDRALYAGSARCVALQPASSLLSSACSRRMRSDRSWTLRMPRPRSVSPAPMRAVIFASAEAAEVFHARCPAAKVSSNSALRSAADRSLICQAARHNPMNVSRYPPISRSTIDLTMVSEVSCPVISRIAWR